MKKCISCGKEQSDNFNGVCPECGGEVNSVCKSDVSDKKTISKKKLSLIIAAVVAIAGICVVGTFMLINSTSDKNTASQAETDKGDNKVDKNNSGDNKKNETSNKKSANDNKVSTDNPNYESNSTPDNAGVTAPEDSDKNTSDAGVIPEESQTTPSNGSTAQENPFSGEISSTDNLEALIEEFNDPNTSEERREELRILLEDFFSMFNGEAITIE